MALLGWSFTSTVVIVAIVLFFILAMINKFGNMFMPFNRWTAFAAGLIPYFIIAYAWALKPALVIGLLLGIGGGIFGGISLGGTGEE